MNAHDAEDLAQQTQLELLRRRTNKWCASRDAYRKVIRRRGGTLHALPTTLTEAARNDAVLADERLDKRAISRLRPVKSAIGERLRLARLSRGWSQRDLERESGVPRGRISDLEHTADPKIRNLRALARALGITLGSLLD